MKRIFFFIFGLLITQVHAADFPAGAQLEIINDFTGGLDTAGKAYKIGHNFSPNMSNVFIHRRPGQLVKRSGFVSVGSTNTLKDGRFGFTFYKEDGSKEFIVSDSSIMLSTKDYQFYTFIASGLNPNTTLECAQTRKKVFCTNGSEPVFSWDGSVKVILDGTNGTPNIPKFKQIALYQERLFGLNTAADGTSLDWSAVVSTGGSILTPDDFRAWPGINHLSVGAGEGDLGTALWVFRGQLQIGKQRSIWTLYGNSDSTYAPRKTEQRAGVSSQDSITLLDGYTYYKSPLGIYAYSGLNSERISDHIKPDADLMQDPTTKIVENTWETQSDFAKGQFSGSTATPSGFLTLNTKLFGQVGGAGGGLQRVFPAGIFGTASDDPPPLNPGTTVWGPVLLTFSAPGVGDGISSNIDSYAKLLVDRIIWAYSPVGGCGTNFANMTIQNNKTGGTMTAQLNMSEVDSTLRAFFTTSSLISPIFEGYDLLASSMSVKVEGCGLDIAGLNSNGGIHFIPSTTVQFISDVSTAATLTAWSNFNSIRNTNQGAINYYFRSSTSVINISTKAWNQIVPGVTIAEPLINNFYQWASTFTSVSTFTSIPNIDNVTIDHIEGSASVNRAFGIDWNNEYWLSISTDLTGMTSLQYVKSWITNSNPIAWMKMQNMNIRSLFKDGATTLYGGSASTGTFYRLDYGTNDNGLAIDAFYETPELTLKSSVFGGTAGNWLEDNLEEYWIDIDGENGNTFRLGTSLNGGAFTEDLINVSGTTRLLKNLYNPSKFGKYFRWRFRNNDLDKGLGLNSFAILHVPTLTR